MLSYEEFRCKTTQVSEENELYPAKEILACLTSSPKISDLTKNNFF